GEPTAVAPDEEPDEGDDQDRHDREERPRRAVPIAVVGEQHAAGDRLGFEGEQCERVHDVTSLREVRRSVAAKATPVYSRAVMVALPRPSSAVPPRISEPST